RTRTDGWRCYSLATGLVTWLRRASLPRDKMSSRCRSREGDVMTEESACADSGKPRLGEADAAGGRVASGTGRASPERGSAQGVAAKLSREMDNAWRKWRRSASG